MNRHQAQAAWVVTSNSNACRIYKYDKKPAQLTLVKEIQHPENKLRDIEITSDKPGHFQAGNMARGAYTQRSDPKEIQIDNFSREIAQELNLGRNNHAYEKLIVVAAPHMNGLIFHHINKYVKERVSHSIKKEAAHLNKQELLVFLRKNILLH